jgi:hypothetical protein
MPGGRTSDYAPDVAADICAAISTCTNSLESILAEDERFPSKQTFYRWMLNHAELRDLYARAKDEQLQILADEIVEIADNAQIGETITVKGEEREVKMADMLQHRNLRIESRKWLLAKLNPKKYGDKLGLTGGDGTSPVQMQIITSIPRPPK